MTRLGPDRNGLDAQRSAVIETLLMSECNALTALYSKDEVFDSRVVMARHGFGRGEYKHFRYPLPEIISDLHIASIHGWFNRRFDTADDGLLTILGYVWKIGSMI